MHIPGWALLAGVFGLLALWILWTFMGALGSMAGAGGAGTLEAAAGRNVIRGTIGLLGTLLTGSLGLAALAMYILRPGPAEPLLHVTIGPPPAGAVTSIERPIQAGHPAEVVAPAFAPLYRNEAGDQPGQAVQTLVYAGQGAHVIHGPGDCQGTPCWHVRLPGGMDGWLPERLATGERALAGR